MDFNLVLSGLRKGLVASLLLFTTPENVFASASDDDVVDDGAADADVLTFNLTQATPFGTITVDYDGKKSKVSLENTHGIQQAELEAEDGSKISHNKLVELDEATVLASSNGLFYIPGAHIDLSPLVQVLVNPALQDDRQGALTKFCELKVDVLAEAVDKSLENAQAKAQAISDRLAKEQEEREAKEAELSESGANSEKSEADKASEALAALLTIEEESHDDGDHGDVDDNQGSSSSAAVGGEVNHDDGQIDEPADDPVDKNGDDDDI